MKGIESSIYFMLAMMFIGMPSAVIGGIAWECRKRTRMAEAAAGSEASGGIDSVDQVIGTGEQSSAEPSS